MSDSTAVTQLSVSELVSAATDGDEEAWTAIVDRYQALVLAIAHRYRLSSADIEDVVQTVWLQLFTNISRLREPKALPGWIASTTANASLKVTQTHCRFVPTDPLVVAVLQDRTTCSTGQDDSLAIDRNLLREEDRRSVERALGELTSARRMLLLQTFADPPRPYSEISRDLGVPMGSIGPTRGRCLQKLRKTLAMRDMGRPERLAA